MIDKHDLGDNDWFKRLYTLKHKWCPALSNDFFSAGTLSSKRSESTNKVINFDALKTSSLTQFYEIFLRTVKNWRTTEKDKEFKGSIGKPMSAVGAPGLRKHAGELYTFKIYNMFVEDWDAAMASIANKVFSLRHDDIYEVHSEGDETKLGTVKFKIIDGKNQSQLLMQIL